MPYKSPEHESTANNFIQWMHKIPTLDNSFQINKSHDDEVVNIKDNSSVEDCTNSLKNRDITNDYYELQVAKIDKMKSAFEVEECDDIAIVESYSDYCLSNKTKDNYNYNNVCNTDRDNNIDYNCDNAVTGSSSDCESIDCSKDADWNRRTAYGDSIDCDSNINSMSSQDNDKNEHCDKHIAPLKNYRNIKTNKGADKCCDVDDIDESSDVNKSSDSEMTKNLLKKAIKYNVDFGSVTILTETVANRKFELVDSSLRSKIDTVLQQEFKCPCPLRFYGGIQANQDSIVELLVIQYCLDSMSLKLTRT